MVLAVLMIEIFFIIYLDIIVYRVYIRLNFSVYQYSGWFDMKKYIMIAVGIFAIIAFAGASVIETFTVNAEGDRAVLEWNSGIEGNLVKYKIERSEDNISFSYIYEMMPQGDFSIYQYIDDDIMKQSSHRVYYYRIKMIYSNNTYDYSEVKSATLTFSGLQETWGSIKALFK